MGSIVHVLQSSDRKTLIDPEAVRVISLVWEGIRADYASFESDMRAPSSEIYGHAMPGGQYTNLREQARSIGLGGRWKEVAKAYADANLLLGDIVKVTPSSKVVGDLALLMVSQSLDADSIAKGVNDIAYPASLVDMLAGDLGQPPGGWPADLQARVLKTRPAITVRPSSLLPALDLEAQRKAAETSVRRAIRDDELASYLMYPKVFVEFSYSLRKYGPAARLPTAVFFFGMEVGEEVAVTIETGKTLNIQLTAIGSSRDDGLVEVFFELNGQPRVVRVPDRPCVQGGDTGVGRLGKSDRAFSGLARELAAIRWQQDMLEHFVLPHWLAPPATLWRARYDKPICCSDRDARRMPVARTDDSSSDPTGDTKNEFHAQASRFVHDGRVRRASEIDDDGFVVFVVGVAGDGQRDGGVLRPGRDGQDSRR